MALVESDRRTEELSKYRSGKIKHALRGLLRGPFCVLPDFMILGGQKCGSTSLYKYVIQHPDVLPAVNKEIFYYDRHYDRGQNWYRACFPTRRQMRAASKTGRGAITGEASASYIANPLVPQRLKADAYEPKLIVMLRDPVERALSHYAHNLRKQREPLSIMNAFESETLRLNPDLQRMSGDPGWYSYDLMHYSYLAKGRYAEQLKAWYETVDKSQIMIIESNDFFCDPKRIFSEVVEFLGLLPHELEKYEVFNKATNRDSDEDPEVRRWLTEYFTPHNAELYELIGRKFDWS